MSPETLLSVLSFLINCAWFYKKVRDFVTMPLIKYSLIILVVSYLLKWFGFTKDLLFMMPFKKNMDDDDE